MLQPELYFSSDSPQSPERVLFLATILQALGDAGAPVDSIYRRHARMFLEGEAVAVVASLADIPPEWLPRLRNWQSWRSPHRRKR